MTLSKELEYIYDLLIQNKRVYIVNDIANSFIQLYNSHNDIKEAVVITASPINKDLEEKILSKINVSDLKSINLKNIVNPEILGGFIIWFFWVAPNPRKSWLIF